MKEPPSTCLLSTAVFDLHKNEMNASDRAWDSQFNQMLSFKNEYGHVNVPQLPPAKVKQKYPHLSNFCKTQRFHYMNQFRADNKHLHLLTEERIKLLESVGFEFDMREAVWQNRYKELVGFRNEHGHLNVNKKSHPDLYNWMSYQRMKYRDPKRYRALSNHQIELLRQLDFRWSPRDEIWWSNYTMLRKHKEEKGDLKTSLSALRRWKNNMRRSCREYVLAVGIEGSTAGVYVSGLNQQRLQALKELRFCWLPDFDGPLSEEPPEDIFAGYQ